MYSEQVLHLWLETLCSCVEVVEKWYQPWSFMRSPGWVQIKCELRSVSTSVSVLLLALYILFENGIAHGDNCIQSNPFSITTFNVTLHLLSQNFSSPASSHTKYPLCTPAIVTPSNITIRLMSPAVTAPRFQMPRFMSQGEPLHHYGASRAIQ